MDIKRRIDLNQIIDLEYPVAEIGVAEGRFSLDMLNWGVPKIYLVDMWQNMAGAVGDVGFPQEWHDMNLAIAKWKLYEHRHKTIFLKGMSADVARQIPDKSLGLVYLDAGHLYNEVLTDLEAWVPKLIPGGICAGHDFEVTQYGVKDAVHQFTRGRYNVNLIPEDKWEDSGFWFQV